MAKADWFGNLLNWIWGYILFAILGTLYYWWAVPLSSIFLNDWTVMYKSIIGFKVLPPAVASY